MRVRFDEVLAERGAALDRANVSGVHDMRVATRRLRGALRDFGAIVDCLQIRRVTKELKTLADELGAVRDQDVAILALENLKAECNSDAIRHGIELLIGERRVLREGKYLDLLKVVSDTSIEDLQQKFTSAVDVALGQRQLFQPASLRDAGRDVITARLQELVAKSNNIYEPFNDKALHRLRIAAKRLRYAIVLFGTCWGGALDPFADQVSKMQSCLGEIHDCDVWIGNLGKRLKLKGRKKTKSPFPVEAASWILSEFVRKRSKEYRLALDLWREWKRNDLTERLRAMISQG